MDIILNPVVISVVLMIVLCLIRVNVYISIIVSGLVCSLLGGISLMDGINLFISGMGNNGEIVFCMLMFGILSVTMEKVEIGAVLAPRASKLIGGKVWILPILLCIMGAISESFILIYVAFVPIIIPPLLNFFNEHYVDRRMLVTAILSGLQIGYVCIPAGFGRMFQEIVQGELSSNGLEVSFHQVWRANLIIAVSLILSVFIAVIVYRKPRNYKKSAASVAAESMEFPKIEWKHIACILAALLAVVIQAATDSMPLGAMAAVLTLVITRAIPWKEFDKIALEGIASMAYVGFVLMAATGFANVTREVGKLDELVAAFTGVIGGNKLIGAMLMMLLGLLVTMGIGSAWSTAPIVATVIVPVGTSLGFSAAAIILMVSAAAALGDSGSPSSDQTLVPTAAFNMDGQHDHIRDTCIPTFLCINIPLLIIAAVAACII